MEGNTSYVNKVTTKNSCFTVLQCTIVATTVWPLQLTHVSDDGVIGGGDLVEDAVVDVEGLRRLEADAFLASRIVLAQRAANITVCVCVCVRVCVCACACACACACVTMNI